MKIINNLKFVWKYAKSQKFNLIMFIIGNIIKVATSIIAPILSAKIIIELTSNNYMQIILVSLVILFNECIYCLFEYIGRKCSLSI